MKLELGKMYTLYTTNDYIMNKQLRILGLVTYEEASHYSNFVENVSINEKFIDVEDGDTIGYLKKQTFYKCVGVEFSENEFRSTGEIIILWDDIIDSDRTELLNENYTYRLSFMFKNISSTDNISKEDVINTMISAVNEKYNSQTTKVKVDFEHLSDDSILSVENQLVATKETLAEANTTIAVFNAMTKEAAKVANSLVDNNIVARTVAIEEKIGDVETSLNSIFAKLK